ncbi:MAG: hypothetical protein JHC66_06075 [Acidimicrobiia bacterium]|nr:hypothetical protein [Acidimicrobiia bacterium]
MRLKKTLIASLLLITALPLVLFASASAITGPANLVIDTQRLQSSVIIRSQMFTSKDCAYIENNLTGTGKRSLMRFDVTAANRGTAPLVLGNPIGNPLFNYSSCHRHYHFNGYASYELFRVDPRTNVASPVVVGRKQAFCLLDYERDPSSTGAGPAVYTCSNQGISVGWQDTYGSYLDGQWLDITGIASGKYWLRVIINPLNVESSPLYNPNAPAAIAMAESNYTDNVAVVPVTIPAKGRL